MNTGETAGILRRAEDLAERTRRSATVTNTAFLTPAEQYAVSEAFAHRTAPLFTGGAEECERRCAFFLPEYLPAEDFSPEEEILCVHFKSYFGQPGHRDYLGAVLSQGIGRERIGDIRIREGEAWIFCLRAVAPLLLAMERVGRYTVKAEECPLAEVPPEEVRREAVSFTVSSLRLDAVTGGLFRMSRSAAADQIRMGAVSLNYTVCDKVDAPIREGDVISLRGKGKGSVTEIGGKSRKDRIFVTGERRT